MRRTDTYARARFYAFSNVPRARFDVRNEFQINVCCWCVCVCAKRKIGDDDVLDVRDGGIHISYRFVAQLLHAAIEKGRLSDTCRHIAHHIEVKVRMQRHVLVEAALLRRLRIADACVWCVSERLNSWPGTHHDVEQSAARGRALSNRTLTSEQGHINQYDEHPQSARRRVMHYADGGRGSVGPSAPTQPTARTERNGATLGPGEIMVGDVVAGVSPSASSSAS